MVDHPFILRGLRFATPAAGPTLVQRSDQNFIAAILDELGTETGRTSWQASIINHGQPELKLYQPVHRLFHVALLEIACDTFGQPRLDPARIESAGLVVRRLRVRDNREIQEGWMRQGARINGWMKLFGNALELDPDPAQRRLALRCGNAEIDRRLAAVTQASAPLTETVAPLFVAPPDVCQAAKRTILYGLVPVTSAEISEGTDAASLPYDLTQLVAGLPDHLPVYLRARPGAAAVAKAGKTVDSTSAQDVELQDFVLSLRQLKYEFDAFGDSLNSVALRNEMQGIILTAGDTTETLDSFLQRAAAILLDGEDKGITMPQAWPPVDEARAARLQQHVAAILTARLADFATGETRFNAPQQRYRVRAFVRVREHDGCPPKLVWSANSEPFTIAQWFESGALPPVQINLPDASDKGFLQSLKPNVAFVLPEGLFNLLNRNNPKDLLEGNGSSGGGGIGWEWICSFSIPIITLCAFIVLNIFLQLFDLIFRWLLFIKICIPFPRPK